MPTRLYSFFKFGPCGSQPSHMADSSDGVGARTSLLYPKSFYFSTPHPLFQEPLASFHRLFLLSDSAERVPGFSDWTSRLSKVVTIIDSETKEGFRKSMSRQDCRVNGKGSAIEAYALCQRHHTELSVMRECYVCTVQYGSH